MKLDLNCDLGEGEPPTRTRALMRWITSANVACGGHAGDLNSMEVCVRLARRFGVRLVAHPGPWNRADFGRGAVRLASGELELLLLQQVGALGHLARASRVQLHHIKLHGALYHASEEDELVAREYVATVKRFWPQAKIYARAGGSVVRHGRRSGLTVWEEAFADRGYREDGTLVPRNEPGALLTRTAPVIARVKRLLEAGEVTAASGARIRFRPQTICLHSDTAHAVDLARAVSNTLGSRRVDHQRIRSRPSDLLA